MSAPFSIPTSKNYEVACRFIRCANNKDFDGVSDTMADECMTQLWPSSMRQPGFEKPATKGDHTARGRQMFETFIDYLGVDIDHPVNVVEGKDVIVLQFNSDGRTKAGIEMKQEYLHIFRFNADNKIIDHDEWMDSAYAMKIFSVMPKFGEDGQVVNQAEGTKAAAKA